MLAGLDFMDIFNVHVGLVRHVDICPALQNSDLAPGEILAPLASGHALRTAEPRDVATQMCARGPCGRE